MHIRAMNMKVMNINTMVMNANEYENERKIKIVYCSCLSFLDLETF